MGEVGVDDDVGGAFVLFWDFAGVAYGVVAGVRGAGNGEVGFAFGVG